MSAATENRKAFFTLKAALQTTTGERSKRQLIDAETGEVDWVLFERKTMHDAVNKLREQTGRGPVALAQVEQIERSAVGHSDYVEKFALRCADLVTED